ncbi:MAG: hypothetical protein DME32_05075 [Verrucomicrobia bacterium]|nr:MAG: hypothetical protein DME32_05075 [Verrucomicrobiota bacterium]
MVVQGASCSGWRDNKFAMARGAIAGTRGRARSQEQGINGQDARWPHSQDGCAYNGGAPSFMA